MSFASPTLKPLVTAMLVPLARVCVPGTARVGASLTGRMVTAVSEVAVFRPSAWAKSLIVVRRYRLLPALAAGVPL